MRVINSRTRGLAPMMMRNLNEEASNHDTSSDELVEGEVGELYRLEVGNGKKVFTKPGHDSVKGNTEGGGKGRTDKECFRCGRIGHIRADCRAKTLLNGGPRNLHPKEKELKIARKKSKKHRKTCRWRLLIWVRSFEVLSDHDDTEEDGEESSFFNCWDEQSDVLHQADPWARNAPKSKSSAKGCTSLSALCVKSWVCTANSCQLQLPNMTSPVREKVDLTKFQRKPPQMTTLTMMA